MLNDDYNSLVGFFRLSKDEKFSFDFLAAFKPHINKGDFRVMLLLLEDEGVIIECKNGKYKYNSDFTKHLNKHSNFINYYRFKKEKERQSELSESLSLQALKNNVKLSGLQIKKIKPTFRIAVIGCVLGIASIAMQIWSMTKTKPQEQTVQPVQKADSATTAKEAVFKLKK